jgi:hypothetical protein
VGLRRDRAYNRKAQPVVVGVADHGGWAILVSAAAVNGRPVVVDRRRVPIIDTGVPSQPYHHDTLTLGDDEAEALLRTVKRSVAACTTRAFDHLAGDLEPQYRVTAITIREPPLARLPATAKEAHASYHVQCRADGMLYHSALCEAASRRDWSVVRHPRGEEMARAAAALRCSPRDVEQFIGDLKATLRPPWAAEHRNAFAAALAELSERTRLRLS